MGPFSPSQTGPPWSVRWDYARIIVPRSNSNQCLANPLVPPPLNDSKVASEKGFCHYSDANLAACDALVTAGAVRMRSSGRFRSNKDY